MTPISVVCLLSIFCKFGQNNLNIASRQIRTSNFLQHFEWKPSNSNEIPFSSLDPTGCSSFR